MSEKWKCRDCMHAAICRVLGNDTTCHSFLDVEEVRNLTDENKKLRRRIVGLETQVSNYKRKEEKRFAEVPWKL